jgi:hypothetical protein
LVFNRFQNLSRFRVRRFTRESIRFYRHRSIKKAKFTPAPPVQSKVAATKSVCLCKEIALIALIVALNLRGFFLRTDSCTGLTRCARHVAEPYSGTPPALRVV